MSTDKEGFAITPARVAFALSLIGVLTFGYKVAAHAVTQEVTIQAHADYIAEDKKNTKDILAELKELNRKVDRLTFNMEGKEASKASFDLRNP